MSGEKKKSTRRYLAAYNQLRTLCQVYVRVNQPELYQAMRARLGLRVKRLPSQELVELLKSLEKKEEAE